MNALFRNGCTRSRPNLPVHFSGFVQSLLCTVGAKENRYFEEPAEPARAFIVSKFAFRIRSEENREIGLREIVSGRQMKCFGGQKSGNDTSEQFRLIRKKKKTQRFLRSGRRHLEQIQRAKRQNPHA